MWHGCLFWFSVSSLRGTGRGPCHDRIPGVWISRSSSLCLDPTRVVWNTLRLEAHSSPALSFCSTPCPEGRLYMHMWCISPCVHIPADKPCLPRVYCWAACCRRQVWAPSQIFVAATVRRPHYTSYNMDPKNSLLFSFRLFLTDMEVLFVTTHFMEQLNFLWPLVIVWGRVSYLCL